MSVRTGIDRTQTTLVMFIALLPPVAVAQTAKTVAYTVGPRANIQIINHYGSITVRPSGTRQVVVTSTPHSDTVSFENEQHGNRVSLRAFCSQAGTGLAEYTVLVPSDAFVTLQSSDGILRTQGLRGDVILQSVTAPIEATDISDAYVSVKTLSGSVLLTDIRKSHVNVNAISGNVNLHNVTDSSVEVHSASGGIAFEGDPGRMGEYVLTSHAGDIEISVPASAAAEVKARSDKGHSDAGFEEMRRDSPLVQGNLLLKRGNSSASRFMLRSFKGNIHVKRP